MKQEIKDLEFEVEHLTRTVENRDACIDSMNLRLADMDEMALDAQHVELELHGKIDELSCQLADAKAEVVALAETVRKLAGRSRNKILHGFK